MTAPSLTCANMAFYPNVALFAHPLYLGKQSLTLSRLPEQSGLSSSVRFLSNYGLLSSLSGCGLAMLDGNNCRCSLIESLDQITHD